MKKQPIYIAVILMLFTLIGVNQFDQKSANASVRAKVLQTYSPSSDSVQVTKSVRGVANLVFINKRWSSKYIVKFSKNQILDNKKELKIKLPGNSKPVYVTYVSGNHIKGYIASKFVKAYYSDDDDSDSDNSDDTNGDDSTDTNSSNDTSTDTTDSDLTILRKNNAINDSNTKTTSNVDTQNNLNSLEKSNAQSASQTNINSNLPTTTLEYAFEHNLVTNQQEVNLVPWSKAGTQDVIEPLYDNRNVYYHINSTGDFATAWQRAINDWNNLGVVQFIPTNSTDNNHVLMLNTATSVPYSTNNYWSGLTTANDNYRNQTHVNTDLSFNNCYLNPNYLLKNNTADDQHDAEITAEHELGHFLGFAHDQRTYGNDARRSTMNSGGYSTPQNDIGAKEQYALSSHYNLSILPNAFKYPYFDFDEVLINYHLQMSDNYPLKNKLYNYKTNNYYN